MKLPPQKPVGNGYYGYEEVANSPGNTLDTGSSGSLDSTPDDENTPNEDNDFAEYMWMENEEEFDKQVLQQLEEEELMEQCLEAMLEEEHRNVTTDGRATRNNQQNVIPPENNDILNLVDSFKLELVDVAKSTLNPLAAEFVPDQRKSPPITKKE